MRYPAPGTSVLLTSGGTWSLIALAICACCAAVGFLSRHPAGKRKILFADRRRFGGSEGIWADDGPDIMYRQGSPNFRWDQVGLEHLRAAERPTDTPSL